MIQFEHFRVPTRTTRFGDDVGFQMFFMKLGLSRILPINQSLRENPWSRFLGGV